MRRKDWTGTRQVDGKMRLRGGVRDVCAVAEERHPQLRDGLRHEEKGKKR